MAVGLIPEEIINQIRERVDIADVVANYVALSRTGQNLKGLCPFHSEKSPSFTVSPSRQIFHCFGCGTGGNVFTFVMKLEGTSFPDTVRELGRRAGIAVPAFSNGPGSAEVSQRGRLELLHQSAMKWFQRNLWETESGRHAQAYLEERGIQRSTIENFGLGVSLATWDGLIRALLQEHYSIAEIASSGLVVTKEQSGRPATDASGYYDRFRGRLMFPITDLRKRVIGFGGRVMGEGEPKYLNSPETPLFSKGRTLYAFDRARDAAGRDSRLVIVEGYFDAIALHQAGITNVAATLGTALTPDHLTIIRRFAQKVVLLFDPDPAGVRAALRTLDLFVGSGLGVTVISLPDGHDPDTFIKEQGPDAFRELQERAPSLLDFAVEQSLQRAVSGSIDDRLRSVDEILRILQKTTHRIEQEECMRRVAERLGLSQQRLIERYPELRSKPDGQRPVQVQNAGRSKRHHEEWELAYCLLQGKFTADQLRALQADLFTEPLCRRIVEIGLRHVAGDGRVLVRPILDEGLKDPECSAAITELSMSERHFDDVTAYIDGCLDALERKQRQQALGELIRQLRIAEREGRADEAQRLNAQVNTLRLSKASSLPIQTS
ncbi:MAG TPA: DNA primase [Nitrospiraceae bacterium]|nr:DNA primase [Nitrospiraceae bacterium]